MKSDIEWLLQKAAFDESENDKLHRIRVSFENELNEIRAQLQQLKECADLQETLDTLDAKLSLVTSISTEEKTSIIRHRVDALKRRVFEALTEQSNAEGVSNPVDPAKNEGENALCRSRSALQHSSSCSQKGNLLSDEEDSLPCESGRMKSLDAFRELFSYSASIIHRVSHSSQEKEATDNAKAGARTSSSVNSTLRPKQAILTKCLTRSFSQGHQHVSLPSALAIASHTPVRKVDLSLSDPTIQSTQVAPNHSSRSPPPHPPSPPALLRQASSLSRPSSPPPSPPIHRIRSLSTQMSPSSLVFHHRSPPPSPPIHRIRSSSTQISPPSSPVPHPRPPQPPSWLLFDHLLPESRQLHFQNHQIHLPFQPLNRPPFQLFSHLPFQSFNHLLLNPLLTLLRILFLPLFTLMHLYLSPLSKPMCHLISKTPRPPSNQLNFRPFQTSSILLSRTDIRIRPLL